MFDQFDTLMIDYLICVWNSIITTTLEVKNLKEISVLSLQKKKRRGKKKDGSLLAVPRQEPLLNHLPLRRRLLIRRRRRPVMLR